MKIIFNRYPEGKKKALTMSYDDGIIWDKRLVEIFNKNGIRGTFHLNSAFLGKDGKMPAEEVKEIYKNHEISCHTATHPFPKFLPKEGLINEICEDRRALEEIAGYPVRGLSYPFGEYSTDIIETFKALGMEYGRTVRATGDFKVPDDFMQWHPTAHHKNDIMNKLSVFKTTERPFLMLFYVWGHSYEFDRDNNWSLIEEFCKEASGLSDVWYATNIEIYDYITALRNLKFSIDCSIVYNPSAIPVWFTANDAVVKVEPGQTLKLC